MVTPRGRIIAGGMLREGTPIEDYRTEYGLLVKREDLACLPPGPPFSKARGVYSWIAKQKANLIGVLDTRHSQGGHAVARACQILDKRCIVFYPEFKHEPGYREPQGRALELGATLKGLPAGRSAILYHQARKQVEALGGAMITNALKLIESVEETARETRMSLALRECASLSSQSFDTVVIPVSSGTIAAGVIRGIGIGPKYILHLGYSRSHDEVKKYVASMAGFSLEDLNLEVIDEGYAYKDESKAGETPPWPCNSHYDLKTFRWWLNNRNGYKGTTLFWNIG